MPRATKSCAAAYYTKLNVDYLNFKQKYKLLCYSSCIKYTRRLKIAFKYTMIAIKII